MDVHTQKNIAGFINSSKGRDPTVRPSCQFVEVINDKMEIWKYILIY